MLDVASGVLLDGGTGARAVDGAASGGGVGATTLANDSAGFLSDEPLAFFWADDAFLSSSASGLVGAGDG